MPGNGPLQKFARGGVLGEAGPEAILPLRRGSSGRLGVEAEPANVNVNVINNAGAEVSVSQDTNGDTTILIEKAKRAIANDIRRGGNDVASAIEGTYRVSRGG
jgi:phage-related minor tail protein